MATVLWRRFNQQYRLTVAQGPEGLHVRGGLVALTAEVIRPGRVQAVRLVEPLLWRPVDGAGSRSTWRAGNGERGGPGATQAVAGSVAGGEARPRARAVDISCPAGPGS